MKSIWLSFVLAAFCSAGPYSATKATEDGVAVVHLRDAQREMDVTVVPSFGNRAVSFSIHGKNILYFPYEKLSDFNRNPDLNGVPFLGPWANRMDASSYWVNGKEYRLNPDLKNYGSDEHGHPIHGLLQSSSLWEIAEATADKNSAWVTCRLPLWKYPELMEQWPFAEEYEMTYRLSNGALEVRLSIANRSSEPVPVAIGFHPYYRIPDKPRDEWVLHLPARKSITVDSALIPTGEFPDLKLPNPLPMKGRNLDDGVADLERDANGRAHFTINSGDEQIELTFGPKYPVAVLWEPPARRGPQSEFVCVEPMSAPTNAINLAHEGKYNELQSVAPGETWTESFWIKPTGF